jgi:hypothetical protein
MSIVVWSERQLGKWTDCVFSAYGMALEYGGFSAFPLGANTAAEREAFAGPNANKASGTTLTEADALAKARYNVVLKPLDTSLANALARPGYALVVTGNYNRLSGNSTLVKDVYAWNGYDKSNPLPSVDHAVTIITNSDGSLTWLDPTAKQGSAGVPVSKEEVLRFAGPSLISYPARMVRQGEHAVTGGGIEANDAAAGVVRKFTSGSTDIFTQADADALYAWAAQQKTNPKGETVTPEKLAAFRSTVDALVGKSYKDMSVFKLVTIFDTIGFTTDVFDAIGKALDPLAQIAAFLDKLTNPSNWLHIGAMFVGVGLVGFGLYLAARDISGSGPDGIVSPMPIILKEGA